MQYKGINLKVVLFVFYNNDFGSYLVEIPLGGIVTGF